MSKFRECSKETNLAVHFVELSSLKSMNYLDLICVHQNSKAPLQVPDSCVNLVSSPFEWVDLVALTLDTN